MLGPRTCGNGIGLPATTSNLVFLSQRVLEWNPKNGERLGPALAVRASNLLEIRPSHMCYPGEFGRSSSNGTSLIKKIAWKFWPSCAAFQGHVSRYLGTETYRSAAYDFLLTFHYSSFLTPSVATQFHGEPLQRGGKIHGSEKNCIFRLKSQFISETVRGRPMVVMDC